MSLDWCQTRGHNQWLVYVGAVPAGRNVVVQCRLPDRSNPLEANLPAMNLDLTVFILMDCDTKVSLGKEACRARDVHSFWHRRCPALISRHLRWVRDEPYVHVVRPSEGHQSG